MHAKAGRLKNWLEVSTNTLTSLEEGSKRHWIFVWHWVLIVKFVTVATVNTVNDAPQDVVVLQGLRVISSFKWSLDWFVYVEAWICVLVLLPNTYNIALYMLKLCSCRKSGRERVHSKSSWDTAVSKSRWNVRNFGSGMLRMLLCLKS